MSAEEKFRIETFYPLLDRIVADLKNRLCAYSETDARFLFLRHHELENSDVNDSLFRLMHLSMVIATPPPPPPSGTYRGLVGDLTG